MEYSRLWLDYKRVEHERDDIIYYNSESREVISAVRELKTAFSEMFGTEAEERRGAPNKGIYLKVGSGGDYTDINAQSYSITENDGLITIESESGAGVLWGTFELIAMIRRNVKTEGISVTCVPDNPLRMLNHWDNADGSIERGYSGNSFFFKDGELMINNATVDYARLIASVGINAVVINNVNVKDDATELITDRYFGKLKELSDIFSDYGIRLFLSINYAAPMELSGLDTADPTDSRVRKWWADKADEIYSALPEFGGFLVKADSEGRPGPHSYGRTQAQGANMLASAIKPHGGTVIWRCFVYNCNQDWRDRKTDRARSCYDTFIGLDGQFDDNVIIQVKNGPMDFQVREPVNPLFGAMKDTNEMMEVQIAQEYTGQQTDLCYLIPWFKEILSFRMRLNDENDTVLDYASGKAYKRKLGGIAAVANTGDDYNRTGHDLAAANLYGFGRLAFDTSLSAEEIAREWTALTYGENKVVSDTITKMLMMSWRAYESYTAPLGVGWMVKPQSHYGPDPDGYEYSRWGTYHYADRDGVGVDRSDTGTGYAAQYSAELCKMYSNIDTCPDELALFFHHLPYTHVLKSGETVIQHIYNSHFDGCEAAEEISALWDSIKALLPNDVYERVRERLDMQLINAREWRDIINSYFYRKSGIKDEKNRIIY